MEKDFIFRISFFILIDQITKLIFSNRDFFVGPLHIHLEKNFGLIFSLNFGLIPNLILVGLALAFFVHYYIQSSKFLSTLGELIFVLIFAGAISNIIDRIYLGYVRDFMDIGWGFTFNVADVYIFLGIILLLYLSDGDKYNN